jgi:outer membrane protein OmpA-like peptidoglycan-associated protein
MPPLELFDRFTFAPNKATVPMASSPLLDAIAATILRHPEVLLIAVQGQVDSRENPRLALARARAIVALLEKRGVAPGRLVARPAGEPAPLCDTEFCRARNRRVDFAILKRANEVEAGPVDAGPTG